jgi:hypothetical protein
LKYRDQEKLRPENEAKRQYAEWKESEEIKKKV